MSKPEPPGLISARLAYIKDVFDADVAKGTIPGAVVLIARQGELAYLESFGFRDREKQLPMTTDSIFRIASMTKPLVSVAIMMLAEEGRIRLVNPVSTYLPELKNLQVGVEVLGALGEVQLKLEPARREMTVQDLLRHTAGLTYGQFGDTLVKKRIARRTCSTRNRPPPSSSPSCRACRCSTSRARYGTTAWLRTYWDAWSR